MPQGYPRRKTTENPQERELNTSGEPDELETLTSGSVGGTRKPTVAIQQGGGCLPYDISVIYLFVDGSYVGEAYCPAFMGQRVNEWEAKAMRQADAAKAKVAAAATADVRAQIQEEIEATKKQRRRVVRESEKARQFDRQRGEIHPPHVLETLESLAPPERESLRLAKATPDPKSVFSDQPLVIRYREKEADQ
ncbi:MAG: hypothetical protein ACRDHZ_01675 [Ktedonobacteraceae bacterium]